MNFRHQDSNNLRIILLTANAIMVVVLGFLLFQQKDINSQNLLGLIVLLANLIYLFFNKPIPPATL